MSRALAIVGTTASGKSDLAHRVARHRGDCEILCVDSMTVYRGMDIGTAKPTPAERAEVPYHLLDVVDPWESFSVAQFQSLSRTAMDEVSARGHVALLVGGTGLYSRAVIDNLDIPSEYPVIRERLEREASEDLAGLFSTLLRLDPAAAERCEPSNARRIVRALEVIEGSGRLFSSFGPGLEDYSLSVLTQVGIMPSLEEIDATLTERFEQFMARGLLDEVARLDADPRGWSRTAAQAVGYKELVPVVRGEISRDEGVIQAVLATRQLVRRQRRWFRRDPRIMWYSNSDEAFEVVLRLLEEPEANVAN